MTNNDRKPQAQAGRQDNRREAVLDVAAALFAREGYHGASMRDIAKGVGMLPGSLYYHFPSKAALLSAVYEEGSRRIERRLIDAVAQAGDDPWQRLRAAAVAHLEAILDRSPYALVVIRVWPEDVEEARAELTELRNRYEANFRRVVEDLPLPDGTDRHFLRLMMLGALNWAQAWYREDGKTPAEIAEKFVDLLQRAGR